MCYGLAVGVRADFDDGRLTGVWALSRNGRAWRGRRGCLVKGCVVFILRFFFSVFLRVNSSGHDGVGDAGDVADSGQGKVAGWLAGWLPTLDDELWKASCSMEMASSRLSSGRDAWLHGMDG